MSSSSFSSSIKGRKKKSMLKSGRKLICVICEGGRIKKSSLKSRPIFICEICKARKKESLLTIEDEEAKAPSDGLTLASNNILPQPPAGQEAKKVSPWRPFGKTKSPASLIPPGKVFCPSSDDEDETDEEKEEEDASPLDFEPQTKPALPLMMKVKKYCIACFSKEHHYTCCPYKEHIPRGANFNHEMFEIICECDCPFFDTDNWVCRSKHCGSDDEARMVRKKCYICNSCEHITNQCTKDKDKAAIFISCWEEYYLGVPMPKELLKNYVNKQAKLQKYK